MTEVSGTLKEAKCNGNRIPEHGQQIASKINEEMTDVDKTPPFYRGDSSSEDLCTEGNQEQSGKSPGHTLTSWCMDEKIVKETSAEEMTFREGQPWEKIPLISSTQERSRLRESIAEQPLEEVDEDQENKAPQATEIEWLGFRKPNQVDILQSKHYEEQEVWNAETHDDEVEDCNDDEDEVRVIEFKKKHEEGSQMKEEGDMSEDSPLSSPSSQPATPDEQPMLAKKGDISRNAYSRYNTISYRKIRKGNTKQRIDEFESMMHL
ncbi:ermin isoform X2 [Perognathus longimembris pacificus]|uniref:ermin isoform X2 n=1 Tax=Perognathus longimembris pacificus TaxID=214514 RepID=UPI0020195D79|nr:ermin isoform X2 [Perognathus longimembris pacificus]